MNSKKVEITKAFDALQANLVDFIVLRGFSDLPNRVSINNDVDILCKPDQKSHIRKIFYQLGYKFREDSNEANRFLYGAMPHQHFFCDKRDLHFDLVYSLSYKSPNQGEWVSIHQEIQQSIWNNRKEVKDSWRFEPSNTDLALHLICHSVFDKKQFKMKHIQQLEKILPLVDRERFLYLMELVFFKFTPTLVNLIERKKYQIICSSYIEFKDY